MISAAEVLRRQWRDSGDGLSRRLRGPGERMFPDLEIPGTADGARSYWRDSREPISAWLAGATDEDLRQMRPSHQGKPRTAGDMMMILVDEQIHHGAEIALLRDLFRSLAPEGSSPAAGAGPAV